MGKKSKNFFVLIIFSIMIIIQSIFSTAYALEIGNDENDNNFIYTADDFRKSLNKYNTFMFNNNNNNNSYNAKEENNIDNSFKDNIFQKEYELLKKNNNNQKDENFSNNIFLTFLNNNFSENQINELIIALITIFTGIILMINIGKKKEQ